MEETSDLLGSLSDEQSAAVRSPDGRTLVVAGAGTGKTRTLTARIAMLVKERGIPPEKIVAVSFTNKAANEIRERVLKFVGEPGRRVRVGTFHALGARLLRRWPQAAGLQDGSFGIVDEDASLDLVILAAAAAGVMGEFRAPDRPIGLEEQFWEGAIEEEHAKRIAGLQDFAEGARRQIVMWKSWGLDVDAVADRSRAKRDQAEEVYGEVYVAYQEQLRSRNMVDFGDLVLEAVRILDRFPEALALETAAIEHLLVDEAQDLNPIQMRFARHLSSYAGNLFVVGDGDQSIMGFQGSSPQALQEVVGADAKVFNLTANRRCTDEILRPANEVVNWNRRRGEPRKSLLSGRAGPQVGLVAYDTEIREAHAISERIQQIIEDGTPPNEIAVLLRSKWTMRAFEEAMLRKHIPFRSVGGSSLLDRAEVRDLIAYLRMAVAPRDDLSFRRIANRPTRSIGASAIEMVVAAAKATDKTLHEACFAVAKSDVLPLRKEAAEGLVNLGRVLEWLAQDAQSGRPAANIVDGILSDTGYERWVEKENPSKKGKSARSENIRLVRRIALDEDDAAGFLQSVALMTDVDDLDADVPKVRISTIHSSKGLEFDHVFLPCWEQGVFPHPRALQQGSSGNAGDPWNGPSGGGAEEERRLAHVALTRAKKEAHVSFALVRTASTWMGGPSSLTAEANLELSDAPGGDLRARKPKKISASRKSLSSRR